MKFSVIIFGAVVQLFALTTAQVDGMPNFVSTRVFPTLTITSCPENSSIPPDRITTVTGSCTATSSCAVTTIPPPADCTHPCTTTVITYPPPGSSAPPPDVTTTVTGSCTATTSCAPVTVTPPPDCTHPCTTTVTTFPGTPSTSSSTPPDVITTVPGVCTSTAPCAPVTVTPPPDCTHPCTTTVTTFPGTPSTSSNTPPDVITTVPGVCTSTAPCAPVTVTPPPDCTHPCTTTVTTFPGPPSTSSDTPPSTSSDTPPSTSSDTPPSTSSDTPPSTSSVTTPSTSPVTTPSPTPSPTSSSTSSSTSSTPVSTCVRPACPTGITRATYPNAFGTQDNFNSRFNTTYYKENTPNAGSQQTVDSFSSIDGAADNFVSFEFATFVYSCSGGPFSFTIDNADDIALAWFGDVACGDFQKNNNQTYASYEGGPGKVTFTTTLGAGQYLPIRIIYANAAGPAYLDFNASGPNGTIDADLFYPVPCDASNAFMPFGTEAAAGRTCVST